MEEPWMLDDPARLKALAHPMRQQMLRHLEVHGPATSTTLGDLLGAKTGTTSYHLRQLEKYGFIEEIPERSAGRERWWRRSGPGDIRLPTPDQLPPEGRDALMAFHRVALEEDRQLLDSLPAAYAADPDWVLASRGLAWLTKAEVREFFDDYMRLLRAYQERRTEGSRPVQLRFFTVPADD
ncbi:ArsR/SmtB family transcription factor [Nonomuraea sp. NPDC050663]|uniref:ArsR/SmtB family transcription factor n=1 Tax=Nonomuraea sp. NPDC050663 TaxID=3364370 RepID=UPI00378ED0BD